MVKSCNIRTVASISLLIYNFLLLFSFYDPGRHGTGRHTDHMLPEIPKEDFRKGSQVIADLHILKMHARSLIYKDSYITQKKTEILEYLSSKISEII